MIDIGKIVEGIANCLITVDKELKISDDEYYDVSGDCVVIKVIDNTINRQGCGIFKRNISVDVVYLALMESEQHEIQAYGQRLLESLMQYITFEDRYIYPLITETRLIDKDYHILFNLEFLDDDGKKPSGEYMRNLYLTLKRS